MTPSKTVKLIVLLLVIFPAFSFAQTEKNEAIYTYKKVDTVALDLTVVYPADFQKNTKHPAIIFFFGGGWKQGNIDQFRPHAQYFASRGMVAVLADYRVASRHHTTPFEAVKDAKSAIRFLRKNAAQLGINPDSIVAAGGSAGGHLAAAAGTITGLEEAGEDLSVSSKPNALVLFNPVFDNGPQGYGYERVGERYPEISPLHNIRQGAPPTIIFLGTEDNLIPVATAKAYQAKMQEAGSRCDLFLYEGEEHGFFNVQHKKMYENTLHKADRFLSSLGYLKTDTVLKQEIAQIIQPIQAEIGVAVMHLTNGDTLTVNGNSRFPMQSVYKFPLAMAVLHQVDKGVLSMEQPIRIRPEDLLPNTWSPLAKKYPKGGVEIPLREILSYTVAQSDNSGCDILFRLLGGPKAVEKYIHSLGVKNLAIVATEAEMHQDTETQFTNWSQPVAMVQLLDIAFQQKALSPQSRDFLWQTMTETATGAHRLKGLLPPGTTVAHKTGTGGTSDAGITSAINDAGIIVLPDGSHLAIAVFVSNTKEALETGEEVIARIARAAYTHYAEKAP